ncbi:MAG: F0F1 ATP synthase subunit A [Oscillospiraceae bacterium]|jgi:F-type H+-transporting ATPase subunit a|nr:F0F1 ATP synthase subunit A [Oscillospiraceae bacterium]
MADKTADKKEVKRPKKLPLFLGILLVVAVLTFLFKMFSIWAAGDSAGKGINFDVKNYAVLHIGGVDVWITESLVNAWIIMAVLIVFAIAARVALKKFGDVPKGFQNIIEMLVEFFDNFVKGSAGERLMPLGNWYFMVFGFILVSNLSGLVGLRPPTADWTMTFTFALITFILIQSIALKAKGGRFFKQFINPLNIIGEVARPISLSFRLFGNIVGGLILMSLIYGLVPVFVKFGVPAALHFYFDLFAGVLQAYIFSILSLSFIAASSSD